MLVPVLAASLGVAAFTLMDAMMKGLSIGIGVYNAMLWRMLAGTLLGGAVYLATGARRPSREAFRLHLLRSAVAVVVSYGFFWGIVRVPLAEGIAITFIAPLVGLYLARVMLREQIVPRAVLGSLLGMAGVGVILASKLRPGYDEQVLLGMAALVGSAFFYGFNLVLQRQQALLASPVEVAFFQSLLVFLMLALVAPFFAVAPAAARLPEVLGIAALSLSAVALMSWAYGRAQAQVLLPVEYTGFVWAAAFGWVFFGEELTLAGCIGTALIVAGCFMASYRRRRAMA
ncbi:MAG: DMT family transporter [Gammaproteobacteria bacterium]